MFDQNLFDLKNFERAVESQGNCHMFKDIAGDLDCEKSHLSSGFENKSALFRSMSEIMKAVKRVFNRPPEKPCTTNCI